MKRDATLDYLRGFAILSIVLGHLYFFSGRADDSIVWNICNSLQIPVFIYVSGLLASKSILRYRFKEFLNNRVKRLIIPFLSFFFLWLFMHGITFDNTITFVFDEFKQGFWFLIVLFELMAILALKHLICQKYNINHIVFDSSAIILISTYHFATKDLYNMNRVFCLNLLWHYYPIFLMGTYSKNISYLFKFKFSLWYFSIYCIAFYFFFVKDIHITLAICNLSSLFFLVTIFYNGFKIAASTFVKAGQFSLEIYLLHVLILSSLGKHIPIIEHRWIEAIYYFFFAGTICFLLVIVSSVLKRSKVVNQLLFGE